MQARPNLALSGRNWCGVEERTEESSASEGEMHRTPGSSQDGVPSERRKSGCGFLVWVYIYMFVHSLLMGLHTTPL